MHAWLTFPFAEILLGVTVVQPEKNPAAVAADVDAKNARRFISFIIAPPLINLSKRVPKRPTLGQRLCWAVYNFICFKHKEHKELKDQLLNTCFVIWVKLFSLCSMRSMWLKLNPEAYTPKDYHKSLIPPKPHYLLPNQSKTVID